MKRLIMVAVLALLPSLARSNSSGAPVYVTNALVNTLTQPFYVITSSYSFNALQQVENDIFQMTQSTVSLQSQSNQLSASTVSLQGQITGLPIAQLSNSTASLQSQVNAIYISTASLQTQVNALPIAQLSASTVSLQGQINSLPLAQLSASTAALQSSKVNRSGDTMTGPLTISSVVFNAANQGIHWADGSTSTTAFSGGGGISTVYVNGSMNGNGSAGSPLGVNSSSVPVFQSGAYPAASGAAITSLTPGNISAGTAGISITGNAASVSNGGVDFSTITTALNGKLGSTAAAASVVSGGVDFSTITTALNGKISTGGQAGSVASGGVDFSTITTAISFHASSVTCPSGSVVQSALNSGSTCVSTITNSGYATNSGNAATVTAGVYTTGSYNNPSWLVLSTAAISSGKFGDSYVSISTAGVSAGKFGDSQVSISTGAVASGKFGDAGVSISTGAISAGKFGDSRLSFSTAALSGGNWLPAVLPSTVSYTNVDNAFSVGQTFASTATIQGNAFSVGGSTFTVSGGTTTINGALFIPYLAADPASPGNGQLWIKHN